MPLIGLSQQTAITQVVKGKVMDEETRFQLIGATVCLLQNQKQLNCVAADVDGKFRFEEVPVGKYQIQVQAIGYQPKTLSEVVVISGQQTVLNIMMSESAVEMEQFEVTASKKGQAMNDMATVSTRSFSLEEAQRYAGSRQDPARMATNYAGCQGTDDSRNDVVVRGNSPSGVLYRLEGIDMPNPNHFAIAGTGGGPISIINSKVLNTSDFYTGAFPAEISNSVAGAFDLKLRNGNTEKYEFTGQFGLLGTEVLVEGPINKKKGSSFVGAYRYANFALFQKAGIDIGTTAIPKYQDFSLNIRLPGKHNDEWHIFGLGGMSHIDIQVSNQKDTSEIDLYGDNDRDQFFATATGIGGVSYANTLSEKARISVTTTYSGEYQHADHDYILRHVDTLGEFVVDSIYDYMNYQFTQQKISSAVRFNYKFNKKNSLRAGITVDHLFFSFHDSILNEAAGAWRKRWRTDAEATLYRAFVQWKHKFSDKVVLNAGLNSQYFTQGDALSPVEPRIGLKITAKKNQFFSIGAGLHSQWQPAYIYYYQVPTDTGTTTAANRNLGFTKSAHFVVGYDNYVGKTLHIKAEAYYQYLFNVPVTVTPSSFSLVNQGSGFNRLFPQALTNKGTGTNYGVELTIEKSFSRNLYFLWTTSVFESVYTGSDDITRNTSFNGNYITNGLFGKEFSITEKSIIGLGGKVTLAGGKRYGIVDTTSSNAQREIVYSDSLFNEFQFKNYFRTDLRVYWRKNAKKVTHEIALDLINITGAQNILNLTYAPNPNNPAASPIRRNYQLGFLPIFYYKLQF